MVVGRFVFLLVKLQWIHEKRDKPKERGDHFLVLLSVSMEEVGVLYSRTSDFSC